MSGRTDDGSAPSEERSLPGDRGAAAFKRVVSMESRISSALAVALMMALGLGLLTWYYARAMTRQTRAQAAAQAVSTGKAQGEMPLPPLGVIDPPLREAALAPASALPLQPSALAPEASIYGATAPNAPVPQATPGEIAHARRLSGAAFARSDIPSAQSPSAAAPARLVSADSEDTPLGSLSHVTTTAAVPAHVLPTRRLLLPKGAFIDCTLETAIDSTLPGMTTCITATDTFSADGQVVLLERGTKLVGETRGQVQQGAARVFVLWTEARTPAGVVIPLASPGTDELGRAGLAGTVNRHFWERFGAAILISTLDGAMQSAVQSSAGQGAVIYNPSGTQDIMSEVLKATINIPPTIVKQQGARIEILVARDLDFRPVYELRSGS